MLWDLVFIVCLTVSPGVCKPVSLPSQPTEAQCVDEAFPTLFAWFSTHPGVTLSWLRCLPPQV